jgi:hypothetical protein
VQLKYAINAIDRLTQDLVARELSESKYRIGKTPLTFKNAKNVKALSKKLQAAII